MWNSESVGYMNPAAFPFVKSSIILYGEHVIRTMYSFALYYSSRLVVWECPRVGVSDFPSFSLPVMLLAGTYVTILFYFGKKGRIISVHGRKVGRFLLILLPGIEFYFLVRPAYEPLLTIGIWLISCRLIHFCTHSQVPQIYRQQFHYR
jgi:hypothetical protein